jgi:hypothetical protein
MFDEEEAPSFYKPLRKSNQLQIKRFGCAARHDVCPLFPVLDSFHRGKDDRLIKLYRFLAHFRMPIWYRNRSTDIPWALPLLPWWYISAIRNSGSADPLALLLSLETWLHGIDAVPLLSAAVLPLPNS